MGKKGYNFTIDPEVKNKAQVYLQTRGVSMSFYVEKQLKLLVDKAEKGVEKDGTIQKEKESRN